MSKPFRDDQLWTSVCVCVLSTTYIVNTAKNMRSRSPCTQFLHSLANEEAQYTLLGTMCTYIDYSVPCWVQGFIFRYIRTQWYYYDKKMCNVTVVCASRISWWTDKTKPIFRSLSFGDSTFSHFIMVFEWECDHHHQERKTTAILHMHTWLNKSNICCCARSTLTHVHVYIVNETESGINITCIQL